MKKQPTRAEVPDELKWDLTDLYADADAFRAALALARQNVAALADLMPTITTSPAHLLKTVQAYYALNAQLGRLEVYTENAVSQDGTDALAQQLAAECEVVVTDFETRSADFEPAIIALSEDDYATFFKEEPQLNKYARVLSKIRQRRGHVLDSTQEELLSALAPTVDAFEDIQATLDDVDLSFGEIETPDGKQDLTWGLVSKLLLSDNRDLRRQARAQSDAAYVAHQNTFAKLLNAHVHTQNAVAKLRNYPSARAMNLAEGEIPEDVYDTLIEQTHKHLDLLHRYNALRKRVLGLEKMYSYDAFVPLPGGKVMTPSYSEAKAIALKALAPLGPDYLAHIQDEFDHRWIDVVETKGKTSGGYHVAVPGVHSYILLNWDDTYDSLSTLVHESGHAMHATYANEAQSTWNANYTIFTAEIASTTNESLLNAYMLKQTASDQPAQIQLLAESIEDMVGAFFSQVRFAEFEHFMYTTEAAGNALTPAVLTAKWQELSRTYNGDAFTEVPWANAGWAAVPHFFYDYYVYQYATSKAAAIAFEKRILSGDQA
ncbi:M3 family oligoendopeptidase [Lacticaseibacillus hulanensis]|uniref:M3 family oligoendopeptidase n=1 Tax=Lacticaseibacillus hulanensis TaxID=2493111 RepID=UPI000FD9A5F1|nr:M3 family oligoendopeptidase [Lacticaseibacillus hulanensis]